MSSVAFDTSAIVKLVSGEPGHEVVEEYWLASSSPVCSRLTYVEAFAALAAAKRQLRLDGRQLATAQRRLKSLWAQAVVVEINEELILEAVRLVSRYPLKGFDAVHVAAAFAAGALAFVTGDKAQARAAQREGISAVLI